MNRRQFTKSFGMSLAALGLGKAAGFSLPGAAMPQLAITIDDFNIYDTPTLSGAARNQAILDALAKRKLKAAAFVAGKYVDKPELLPLLRLWDEQGHLIGNHTYSHWYYPNIDFLKYTEDILRNEALLQGFRQYRKLLRFPFLKEGKTAEQRDRMRAFLSERGYRNAHVTIDASDWYIDGRLRQRLKNNPQADLTPYREFYLQHLWERAAYYDNLARKVIGRTIKHTLLLHHNVLNGLFLGDVLDMFKLKKWKLINAEEAFKDAVFSLQPKTAPWDPLESTCRHASLSIL